MDDDNLDRHTITVRWKNDSTPEMFTGCTDVESNGEELAFDDNQGKHHEYTGVSYHIVRE